MKGGPHKGDWRMKLKDGTTYYAKSTAILDRRNPEVE